MTRLRLPTLHRFFSIALACTAGALANAQPDRPDGTAAERTAVIEEIAARVETSYVLPEVAQKMASFLREQARAGAYDNVDGPEALSARLTKDLRALSNDGHVRVRYHADPAQVMPAWQTARPNDDARFRRAAERKNFGFVRTEILPGNIGYLRLDEFGDAKLGADTAIAALRFLAHTDALIIDLRANGGGGPGIGALLATSLLGGRRVHLSDFHIRERNETIQSWTLPFMPGPAYADQPVFVLVGPKTASAAESFVYDLQTLKRIRVVGQKTAGAAHPGAFVRVSSHLAVFIPNGRPINRITGTNWEGVGVAPDVDVAVAEALDRAHRLALETLLSGKDADPANAEAWQKALGVLAGASK